MEITTRKIMYKYHKVTGIRKVIWDELWHILYTIGGRETWDRVKKEEALEVIKDNLNDRRNFFK
jgi:uncharacterized membrane protein YjdF